LPNVSDAPIRLQGKVLDNVFESPSEILSSISKFYVMETLRQVYKIIGSLDFVGNPTMLFSSFVSGVRDLVVTPSVAFLRSPTNPSLVGIGVAKGTLSLFSHSTSGIFGFLAKTTAAAGQAAAMLSLDPEYRDWHRERVVMEATNLNREWKKRGVESVSAMMTKPVADVVLGVLMGVSGLVTAPYKGYRDNGNLGLAQGVSIGGIGLVIKPIVGILDAFAHFTASVHDIAKSVNILERRYQPVLKLRLPYIFGLSNVLTPFDSVSTRSVYLLKNYIPKNYSRKTSGFAWKETHVASEVLHMEPGVDTYAIVTTLRVVLIKVKKDNLGRLGSNLCWEVSIGADNKVSSQVSDHGHNGVALTVTRRYKRTTTGRFKALEQRRKLSAAGNANPPQQVFYDRSSADTTGNSQLEKALAKDDATKNGGPDGADLETGRILTTPAAKTHRVEGEEAYHSHGATLGNAGETLEWYTVLAEYPNRPQLTRIHNAISCILGNYDVVVTDQQRNPASGTEGYTTFGLFDFEKNWSDEGNTGSTERHLIAALERLPWMHDTTFEAARGKSLEEQRTIVMEIRDKWIFSRELEASNEMGGPAWLIETRAHAMFVPSEPPLSPPSIPRNDPIIKQILYQQEHGNISREHVRELFESHIADLEGTVSEKVAGRIWRKSSDKGFESDFAELTQFEDFQSAFSTISTTVVHPGRAYHPNLSEFKGQDLESFQSAFETVSTTLVRPGSVMSESLDESYGSDGSTGGQDRLDDGNASPQAEGFAAGDLISIKRDANGLFPLATSQAGGGRGMVPGDPSPSDDRINRMEGLMEQLIVFNSQLALMKGPALVGGGGINFHSGQANADTGALQQELFALRSQLERQAARDEATTEILTGLRSELANIRDRLKEEEVPVPVVVKKKEKKAEKQKGNKQEPRRVEDDSNCSERVPRKNRKGRSRKWFQRGSFTSIKQKDRSGAVPSVGLTEDAAKDEPGRKEKATTSEAADDNDVTAAANP
jgi:Vacuolar-sorting-associated 13 protein C-terminal